MGISERFRGGGGHAIARFLAAHQECDAGFDVHRESGGPGGGRLRVTCKGCGQSVEYRVAEVGEFAAAGLEAVNTAEGGDAGARRAEAQATRPRDQSRPPRRTREQGHPGWLPRALIAALLVGGSALALVGLLNSGGADREASGGDRATAPVTITPAVPSPTPAQPPAATPGGAGAPPPVRLDTRSVPGVFAIGVAPGWESGTSGDVSAGTVTLTAPGDYAQVSIQFESGERPADELADSAAEFLDDRHPDGQVAAAAPIRIGPLTGRRISATYPGGTDVAVVLSANGYSYLVIRQLEGAAPARTARDADAMLASFRST
jgi:hypothetical protein